MPAVNEPTEPNAETQSLQLICSLTPSSTEPSTGLVIIWLKRWPARSLMDLALLPPSVGVGEGVGLGEGKGVGDGEGLGDGEPPPFDGEGDGLDDGQILLAQFWAAAGRVCTTVSMHANVAVSIAERSRLRTIAVIVSARTAWRSDHPTGPHRRNR